MILATLASGSTVSCDPTDKRQLGDLRESIRKGVVTSLTLWYQGVRNALPKPRRFTQPHIFGVEVVTHRKSGEVIGERIFAHVGALRVTLTLTYATKMVRTDLERLGRMRYDASRR